MNHLPCDRHWHSTSGPSFSRLTPPFSTKLNFTRKKKEFSEIQLCGKRGVDREKGGGVQTSSACDDRVYYLIFSGKG